MIVRAGEPPHPPLIDTFASEPMLLLGIVSVNAMLLLVAFELLIVIV